MLLNSSFCSTILSLPSKLTIETVAVSVLFMIKQIAARLWKQIAQIVGEDVSRSNI
jgi:hypothetical protein